MELGAMAAKIQSLTVFCGARSGLNPEYEALAFALGKWMAESQIQLVYGGGSVGLMGAVARGCFQSGGYVIGVIPEALKQRELEFKQSQELIVVKSMHERKAVMNLRGDAFLALPGGFGTLEEIFEIITWRQLGFHTKSITFLDHNQYYTPLIQFMDHMEKQNFISQADRDRIRIASSLEEFQKQWQK